MGLYSHTIARHMQRLTISLPFFSVQMYSVDSVYLNLITEKSKYEQQQQKRKNEQFYSRNEYEKSILLVIFEVQISNGNICSGKLIVLLNKLIILFSDKKRFYSTLFSVHLFMFVYRFRHQINNERKRKKKSNSECVM